MKKLASLVFLLQASVGFSQLIDGPAPIIGAVENDPFANYHQRWNPRMQELFQKVRDDDGKVTYYVGAEVGSPYEYEEFKKGKVYYEEEFLGEFYYRLNLFSNEIEVKRTFLEEEKHKALIANDKVSLVANGKEYRFLMFQNHKNNTDHGYLTTLHNGSNYILRKRIVAKFTEAKPAANSMVNPTPSKFTQFTEYYLQDKKSDQIVGLPTKKKKMLKLFDGALAKNIKEFIAQQSINLAHEKDLVKTIEFIDTCCLQ